MVPASSTTTLRKNSIFLFLSFYEIFTQLATIIFLEKNINKLMPLLCSNTPMGFYLKIARIKELPMAQRPAYLSDLIIL